MSWDDAQAYVSWLSRKTGVTYRLPTEAEWERAAVGSEPGCYEDRTGNEGTCPVGSYGSNAAGLSDMLGNLSEWTEDCGREGSCVFRVMRGGSWYVAADHLRSGERSQAPSDSRGNGDGFRVARTID